MGQAFGSEANWTLLLKTLSNTLRATLCTPRHTTQSFRKKTFFAHKTTQRKKKKPCRRPPLPRLRPRSPCSTPDAGAWFPRVATLGVRSSTGQQTQFVATPHGIDRRVHCKPKAHNPTQKHTAAAAAAAPAARHGAHFQYLRANGCRLVLRISGGCFFSVHYLDCEIFLIWPPWGGLIFSLGSLLGALFRTALCGWTYGLCWVNFSPNSGSS